MTLREFVSVVLVNLALFAVLAAYMYVSSLCGCQSGLVYRDSPAVRSTAYPNPCTGNPCTMISKLNHIEENGPKDGTAILSDEGFCNLIPY